MIYTRHEIRDHLLKLDKWITSEVEEIVHNSFSVRTYIRKHQKSTSVNNMLILNKVIMLKNQLGKHLTYTIFKSICDQDELIYINTVYHFLSYNKELQVNPYYLEELYRDCDRYTKI